MNHYEMSEWAWRQSAISSPERTVLLALLHHCRNGTESCWPSRERLQELTGLCSVQEVSRNISRLRKRGLISVASRPASGRGRPQNAYTLNTNVQVFQRGLKCKNTHPPKCGNIHLNRDYTNYKKDKIMNLESATQSGESLSDSTPRKEPLSTNTSEVLMRKGRKESKPVSEKTAREVLDTSVHDRDTILELAKGYTPRDGVWRKDRTAMMWKALFGVLHTGSVMQPPVGATEREVLWQLARKLGPHAGKYLAVLMEYWPSVTSEVNRLYAPDRLPKRPSIGFLSKYIDVAMELAPKLLDRKEKHVQLIASASERTHTGKNSEVITIRKPLTVEQQAAKMTPVTLTTPRGITPVTNGQLHKPGKQQTG